MSLLTLHKLKNEPYLTPGHKQTPMTHSVYYCTRGTLRELMLEDHPQRQTLNRRATEQAALVDMLCMVNERLF